MSDVFTHFGKHIKFSSDKKVKHNSSEFLVMKILSVVQAVFVLGEPIFCPLGFPLNPESQFFLGHRYFLHQQLKGVFPLPSGLEI